MLIVCYVWLLVVILVVVSALRLCLMLTWGFDLLLLLLLTAFVYFGLIFGFVLLFCLRWWYCVLLFGLLSVVFGLV